MSDCAIVAAATLSGLPYREVKERAIRDFGYDGKGMLVWAAVALVEDCLGKNLRAAKLGGGRTPKTLKRRFTGLVFTATHVMPCVKGKVSNFCGNGEEMVTFTVHF